MKKNLLKLMFGLMFAGTMNVVASDGGLIPVNPAQKCNAALYYRDFVPSPNESLQDSSKRLSDTLNVDYRTAEEAVSIHLCSDKSRKVHEDAAV